MPNLRLLKLVAVLSSFCTHSYALQADYYLGDTLELNTLGQSNADHAVIAVNRYGDVIVVNHTSLSGDAKAVEVNILAPIGSSPADGFKLFTTERLGDPTLDVYQLGGDSCTKPDAETLGDNSFLVVWSRNELSGNHPSRLEICRILTRDVDGDLLARPVILTESAGIGFVIDDVSEAGQGGFMPDIAALSNSNQDSSCIVYAHEESSYNLFGNTHRSYQLRCRVIDWDLTSSQPDLGAIVTLENGIPFDNLGDYPYPGGMVLPDAVIDDGGNLVVAYEQHSIDALNESIEGSIQVRRYSKAPFELIDRIELHGSVSSRHQRRPMLATSANDHANRLLVSWNEKSNDNSIDKLVHFREIAFHKNTAGHANPVTVPWNSIAGSEDNLAYVAVSARAQMLITSKTLTNGNKLSTLFESVGSPPVSNYINTTLNFPWRPAIALYDFRDRSLGYFCFEGAPTNAPNQYRIYLKIQELL